MAFFHDVPIQCINQAAVEYRVPAALIMAIISVEGGKNGLASANANGTFDLGVMQINTRWTPSFSKYGYSVTEVRHDACKNVIVGTSILSACLANDQGNLATAVGNYHSRTPKLNQAYALKVLTAYATIHRVLDPTLSEACKKTGQIC